MTFKTSIFVYRYMTTY